MLRLFKQYYPIRNIFFVMGEFLVIFASGIFANQIEHGADYIVNNPPLIIKLIFITFICQTCLYYNDLYDFKVTDSFRELSGRLLQGLGGTAIILSGVYFLFPDFSMGLKIFIISIGFDIVFIVSWRFGYAFILNRRLFDKKILLVGSGHLAINIFQEIMERKDCGYSVAAVLFEGKKDTDSVMLANVARQGKIPKLTREDYPELSASVHRWGISRIVVALEDKRGKFPTQELLKCRVQGIEVLEGTTFYEMLTGKLIVDYINPAWLIFSEGFQKTKTRLFFKRMIDLTLSVLMLLMTLPIMMIIAAIIKLDRKEPEYSSAEIWKNFAKICSEEGSRLNQPLKELLAGETELRADSCPFQKIWERFRQKCDENRTGVSDRLIEMLETHIQMNVSREISGYPVFFSQERMGKGGRNYRIHKFRSMIVNAERFSGPMWAGEDDKRITRIGHFIRKWRIDELPQLYNVLKGEMSFVGPRPEREHFVTQLEKTIPYYMERLSVKPGVTGWAQVSYGYGASEDDAKEKLNYDLFYIKNMSIPMDMMIVLKTIKIVLFGKGR